MKKIISLVLAISMLTGLSVNVYADYKSNSAFFNVETNKKFLMEDVVSTYGNSFKGIADVTYTSMYDEYGNIKSKTYTQKEVHIFEFDPESAYLEISITPEMNFEMDGGLGTAYIKGKGYFWMGEGSWGMDNLNDFKYKAWFPSTKLTKDFITDLIPSEIKTDAVTDFKSAPYFREFNASLFDESKGGALESNQLTLTVPKGFLEDKSVQEKFGIKLENYKKVIGSVNGKAQYEEPKTETKTDIVKPKDVKVMINGQELKSDVAPYIKDGSTMAPLRSVADAFGFKVGWDESKKITLTNETKTIVMYVNKADFTINEKSAKFDGAVPTVKDGSTFLPLRKLAEILDVKVDWDEKTSTATFTVK